MHELLCLNILYFVREKSGCVTLNDLLSEFRNHITGYNKHNYHILIDLCTEGYIAFLDESKNDISKTICVMDYDDLFDLCWSRFQVNQQIIYVQLTNKLFQIQSLLGFSLNDTIKKYSNTKSIIVTPIFETPDSLLKTDVFVIMPFQKEFNYLYENYIKKVCNNINVSCMRADDLYSSKPIIQDIWSLICNCKIVIADCTNKNPNVMYELGIAHAVGKNVILITQDINDIPFDLRHLRHLNYKYTPDSINLFEDELTQYLTTSFS